MHKIDKFNFSFWAAANLKADDGKQLELMERQRAKVWLKKSSAIIEPLLEQLASK